MAQDNGTEERYDPLTEDELVAALERTGVDIPVDQDVPSTEDLLAEGDMEVVLESYESGGSAIEEQRRFSRAEWIEATGRGTEAWSALAAQAHDGQRSTVDVADDEDLELVRVQVPFWWPESEDEDADHSDTTWSDVYGEQGEAKTLAVVDRDDSEGSGAWFLTKVLDRHGRWRSPSYSVTQPKSVVDIVYAEGEAGAVDEERVRTPDCFVDDEFDPAAGIQAAAERVRDRRIDEQFTADIDPDELEADHGPIVKDCAVRGLLQAAEQYKRLHGETAGARTLDAMMTGITVGLERAANYSELAESMTRADELVEERRTSPDDSPDEVLDEADA